VLEKKKRRKEEKKKRRKEEKKKRRKEDVEMCGLDWYERP